MAQSPRPLLPLVLGLLLVPHAGAAQDPAEDTSRLFKALAVQAGSTVCEIGAGEGRMAIAAAAIVGERGRVFANELGDARVKTLREKVAAAKRPRIQAVIHVVAGEADGTSFPDGACDAVYMRNVYHHFERPAVMNAAILAALRPGGRVAVVDFTPPDAEADDPADRDQDGKHGVTAASVERELKAAGFSVISSETSPSARDRWNFVVAARPTS
jgi:ubiquinone/menaquinone biosynthesis C-methylase UbiE